MSRHVMSLLLCHGVSKILPAYPEKAQEIMNRRSFFTRFLDRIQDFVVGFIKYELLRLIVLSLCLTVALMLFKHLTA